MKSPRTSASIPLILLMAFTATALGRPRTPGSAADAALGQVRASGGITLVTATYGGNCGAKPGNVTSQLARACDGRASCTYVIDTAVIGDPSYGCMKDYVAEWRCGDAAAIHRASVEPEAGLRRPITLACDAVIVAPPSPSVPTPAVRSAATSGMSVVFEDSFARPDQPSPGPDWREYTLRNGVVRAEDTPWRISGNTLRYEATGRGVYWEDFVETTRTFPITDIRVEFELRAQVATSQGYVGPTAFFSGDARNRATGQNVTAGPPQLGVAAWYSWQNRGTRGVVISPDGPIIDLPDASFAGVNQPDFARHVITISGGTMIYESSGFPAATYRLPASTARMEDRHFTFGVRLYDSGVAQVVEVRNLKISTIDTRAGAASTRPAPIPASSWPDSRSTTATGLLTQTVPASGGRIEFRQPGHPLNGFSIDVPSGAYQETRTFAVSTLPASQVKIPPPLVMLSPLIRVDNGGAFAGVPLTLTVPVAVPAGSAVLAFYYDESTGKLEGMPILRASAGAVTVLTSHFSTFFIGAAADRLLPATIDSGFKPGVDDWQVENDGSFATPGGHCTGQSITAMWYYTEKALRHEPRLFNRYDNNARSGEATPGFWHDDSLAVRLIATVWRDLAWGADRRNASLKLADLNANRTIFNAFRVSMLATGEPQLAEIFRYDTTDQHWKGHAVIVYKVDRNQLFVADPNFPGQANRAIEFDPVADTFMPYVSGESAASLGHSYTKIVYVAKTALIPWASLATRWAQFESSFTAQPQANDQIIGREYFPAYQLFMTEQGGRTPLADYLTTDRSSIVVGVSSPGRQVRVQPYRGATPIRLGPGGAIPLTPGYNEIGFYVEGVTDGDWEWLDFPRFKIYSGNAPTQPPPTRATPPPTPAVRPPTPVTPPATTPADPARFSDLKSMQLVFNGNPIGPDGRDLDTFDFKIPFDSSGATTLAIQWSGNRFQGAIATPVRTGSGGTISGIQMTVSGTIRSDGPRLFLDMEVKEVTTTPDSPNPPPYGGTWTMEFKAVGIPLNEEKLPTSHTVAARVDGSGVHALAPTVLLSGGSRGSSSNSSLAQWKSGYLNLQFSAAAARQE